MINGCRCTFKYYRIDKHVFCFHGFYDEIEDIFKIHPNIDRYNWNSKALKKWKPLPLTLYTNIEK